MNSECDPPVLCGEEIEEVAEVAGNPVGVWHYTEKQVSKEANKITGANAGGPPRLPVLAHWAARIVQFR